VYWPSKKHPFDTPFAAQKPFNPYTQGSMMAKSNSSISSLESPIYVSCTREEFTPYVKHVSGPTPRTNDKKQHFTTSQEAADIIPDDDEVFGSEMIHLTLEYLRL
jgi:mannose-6-phosphate isomerase class I